MSDNNDNEEFNLYTEKIVQKPFAKYKRLVKLMRIAGRGAVFGAVACVTFVVLYPVVSKIMGLDMDVTRRTELTIPKDEYPTDDIESELNEYCSDGVASGAVITDDIDDFTQVYSSIRQTMMYTRKSIVSIDSYRSGVDGFINGGVTSTSQTAGVIIAEIDSEYIILTSYDAIQESSGIVARFVDNSEATAYIINSDEQSGIAMLCVKQSDISAYTMSVIKIAQLANSYLVSQGDIVISAGKLMNSAISVNYGIATNVRNSVSAIDSYYGIINTNMYRENEDYGFLFNSDGDVIGVIRNTLQGGHTFDAYGISDLKALIEEMSNGSGIVYCGIMGQNVTAAIASQYNIPVGVYITDVIENSPAYEAGLQPGDVITKVNGESALTFQSFSEKLYKCNIGDTLTLNIKRLGKDEYKDIEFSVVLQSR